MHPEIFSIALFWFVAAYTPGPNNVVASYSGFNFGITKTLPHILGVTLGFTSLVIFFIKDPSIMGGLSVMVGDESLDLSIKGRVKKLINQLNF